MGQDTFSFLLLSGPLCGIIMVLGGILLLYKGAITLSGAAEDALSVEFRKELRITTQYPALGIFVIGLLFVAIPAILGRPSETQPFTIQAKTVDVDEPVSLILIAGGWNQKLWSDDKSSFDYSIGPGYSFSETQDEESFDSVILRGALNYN